MSSLSSVEKVSHGEMRAELITILSDGILRCPSKGKVGRGNRQPQSSTESVEGALELSSKSGLSATSPLKAAKGSLGRLLRTVSQWRSPLRTKSQTWGTSRSALYASDNARSFAKTPKLAGSDGSSNASPLSFTPTKKMTSCSEPVQLDRDDELSFHSGIDNTPRGHPLGSSCHQAS